MNLERILRKGVKSAHKATKSVQEEVTHVAWTGQSGSGEALTTTQPLVMLVEQKLQQHTLPAGGTIEISAELTALEPIPPVSATGRINPVDPRDEFILADGTRGKVVGVGGLRKDTPFVSQIFLGVGVGG